jgi:hypothetical protein
MKCSQCNHQFQSKDCICPKCGCNNKENTDNSEALVDSTNQDIAPDHRKLLMRRKWQVIIVGATLLISIILLLYSIAHIPLFASDNDPAFVFKGEAFTYGASRFIVTESKLVGPIKNEQFSLSWNQDGKRRHKEHGPMGVFWLYEIWYKDSDDIRQHHYFGVSSLKTEKYPGSYSYRETGIVLLSLDDRKVWWTLAKKYMATTPFIIVNSFVTVLLIIFTILLGKAVYHEAIMKLKRQESE